MSRDDDQTTSGADRGTIDDLNGRDDLDDLDMYRQMLMIRRFEEKVSQLFLRGAVYGSTHLCIGHEAVSVGVCGALRETDRVSATYRGHGHALALGVDMEGLLAEMAGRQGGTCGGRAGSMNVVDLRHRLIGCFGIVGGSIAAATGVGLAMSLRESADAISVAFFGDGAVNQGYFMECLNLAAIKKLPVLYVCENNQYAEYTAMRDGTANGILPRVGALGLPVFQVDGNDAWVMREATRRAAEMVRGGGGPTFLLAETYRFSGHGRGDPIDYRPPGEMEAWRIRDPLTVARNRLTARPGVEQELDRVDREVDASIEEASRAVLAMDFPDPSELVMPVEGRNR